VWNQVRDVEDAARRLDRARGGLVDDERFDLERIVTAAWILQNAHQQIEHALDDLNALISEALTGPARDQATGAGWRIGTFRVQLVDGAPIIGHQSPNGRRR